MGEVSGIVIKASREPICLSGMDQVWKNNQQGLESLKWLQGSIQSKHSKPRSLNERKPELEHALDRVDDYINELQEAMRGLRNDFESDCAYNPYARDLLNTPYDDDYKIFLYIIKKAIDRSNPDKESEEEPE